MKNTLVMIMAGGKGSRLRPLTVHRSKPGVPFAGRYRIIDFVLSNFMNSGYRRIYVLTQYMSSSLIKHLSRNWQLVGFVEKPKNPPEMPGRPGWALASMGNYIFRRDVLERVLVDEGGKPASRH